MGSDRPARAEVGRPELVSTDPSDGRGRSPSGRSALTIGGLAVVTAVLGLVLLITPGPGSNGPPEPIPAASSRAEEERPVRPDRRRSLVDIVAGEPVLGVPIGATVISTDFDGRITAVGLDAGSVSRTTIRTGSFVTVGGELVVHTGCGAWQKVEMPDLTLGDQLIDCGSFTPIGQRGAEVALFGRRSASGRSEIVVASGDGELTAFEPTGIDPTAYGAVSAGRVLLEAGGEELVWVQAASGESTHYAEGRLIASGPGGVLWASCPGSSGCEIWFGTPDRAMVRRFGFFDQRDQELLARINDQGSRAVFFLPDGTLRTLALETGHTRNIDNPGIQWSTASWSPDGLWLFGPTGREVVALNTLNGRTVRYNGVPGDVSPGWLAVIEDR